MGSIIVVVNEDHELKKINIFSCCSHKDRKLREELECHLEPLKRSKQVVTLNDRMIEPGMERKKTVEEYIDTSDIILLLISSHFIRSRRCYDVETQRALERYRLGKARVIPVILRPVLWEETKIGELQVLPSNGKPVVKWHNRDDAFRDIAQNICNVVETLQMSTEHALFQEHGYCGKNVY
jgi:TIR domain-containing protein